jgi:hypothetical protein
MRRDEPVRSQPSSNSARRGSLIRGSFLPLYGSADGPGCEAPWLNIGPLAWVCGDHVTLSANAPISIEHAPPVDGAGMPYRYFFVGENGSLGYTDLTTAEDGAPDLELEPGFAVAVSRVKRKYAGDPFGLTTKGYWVPLRDLGEVDPPLFRGVELSDGIDVGWVIEDDAPVFRAPAAVKTGERLDRFTLIRPLERLKRAGKTWVKVDEQAWLRESDLSLRSGALLDAETAGEERFIDVDLAEQIVTLYEHGKPRFATLVSTGRGEPGSEQATPPGSFRIWVKLRTSDMDNLENEEAGNYYAMQEVPWVMYFERGYGLHGTFWHREFGHVRSHGCVNLSPLDARRVFDWSTPRLPAGWSAVLPTRYDPGTLVRIRGSG